MTDFEIRLELARAVCLSTCRAGMCRKSEECCGPGFYGIGLKAALARVNHLLTELKESRTRMVLTEIDRKVLSWMAQCLRYVTPAEIGSAMGGTVSGKAQGLGRMGGRRAKRLIEKGLVEDCSAMRGGFPAYRITALGRQVEQNLRVANG
jgi:hypothetical protein